MTAIHAEAATGQGPIHRTLRLTSLFWVFSYVLLTIRGAIFNDDWGRLLDNNRFLTVSVGAFAYWLVLKQVEARHRITLRETMAWIVGATLVVMIVRVTIDETMFAVPQGAAVNLLWSLTWSAYFGLWVMGSMAFGGSVSSAIGAPAITGPAVTAIAQPSLKAPDVDTMELMIAAVLVEAAGMTAKDRAELAARVLALGGYESVEAPAEVNERARLALRIAARLGAQP